MSETLRRILSAAILVPIYIYSFQYSEAVYFFPLYLVGTAGIYMGLKEFFTLSDRGEDGKPFETTALFFGIAIFTLYYLNFLIRQNKVAPPGFLENSGKYFKSEYEIVAIMIFLMLIISFVLQILRRPLNGAIFSVSTTLLGTIYLSVALGHFMKLLALPFGIYYIYLVTGLTMITDAGAYFGGRFFGRHPAGLKISPKKTWEGYATGIITAVVYALILNFLWVLINGTAIPFGTVETIFFALLFAVITIMGDLAESAMKRDAKTKDSSSVIPGHGGMLDTIDALLFTIPSCYLYLVLKEMMGFAI